MKPIHLNLPWGAKVVGEILRDYSESPERLGQDIVQVRLANGIGIDVGWHPDCELNGEFEVAVYLKRFDNPKIEPIFEKNPLEVARIVEQLAGFWNSLAVQPPFEFISFATSSTNTTCDYLVSGDVIFRRSPLIA